MKIKTSELTGAALDWAVAKCEGKYVTTITDHTIAWDDASQEYFRRRHAHLGVWIVLGAPGVVEALPRYATDWSQGGPIIEREGITVSKEDGCWSAYFRDNLFEDDGSERWQTGPTPLIAAMRCFVASKLGDEVDVPEELK